MNSTYRGAVEIANLCRNLDQRDVLNAECIRTFGEDTIDGRSWMNHLESSQVYMQNQESSESTYIPPTRKPNVRTRHSRVNAMDAYGFRPLEHPWKLLSVYEFLQQWRCEPLLLPTQYSYHNRPARTKWTKQGLDLIKTQSYKDGMVAAKAGEHYVAEGSDTNEYFLFPEDVGYFRHS